MKRAASSAQRPPPLVVEYRALATLIPYARNRAHALGARRSRRSPPRSASSA